MGSILRAEPLAVGCSLGVGHADRGVALLPCGVGVGSVVGGIFGVGHWSVADVGVVFGHAA